MGSALSPVVVNLFMESFEHSALELAPYKLSVFKRCVDDTFIVCPHGWENLVGFLAFMHGNIKFSMEMEENGLLPFLDVLLIDKKQDGSLGHGVYRKPAHMD